MAMDPCDIDLLEVIRKSLTDNGTLAHFKDELRASVMSILNKHTAHSVLPEIPEETKMLNELIREYLLWNGYMYAEQVLVAESGESTGKVRRDSMAAKLGVVDDNKTVKIPMLYFILSAFQNQES